MLIWMRKSICTCHRDIARSLIQQLNVQYKLSGGGKLQWFLGMNVIRDRSAKWIWLSQASDGIATLGEINCFQRKIGSLLYAAVNTRPDIAFATSHLARFLTNPGPQYHAAADRVLTYLRNKAGLALQLGGSDDFMVYSDASFADDSTDRKSSQAYVMKLFGGLIGWRANKQDTVTISITEAKLLALAQAAKEGLYVGRLLKELTVQLEESRIQLYCDNSQTVRLVNAEIARL